MANKPLRLSLIIVGDKWINYALFIAVVIENFPLPITNSFSNPRLILIGIKKTTENTYVSIISVIIRR